MQGFNMGRYIPPDALERGQSFNQASGKGNALGRRARPDGSLVVRFELPFAVWCTTCTPEKIIGQGVRFNAEKKKVGNYYSTPIWSFKFKHTDCGGPIEVRTDPKASEYVVTEGGRRRDVGEGKREEEWGIITLDSKATEEEKDRLEKEGAFAKLERLTAEKTEQDTQTKRIRELYQDSDKRWGDPYEKSRQLRREFRVGRRKRQDDAKTGSKLSERFGLSIELLGVSDEDSMQARNINFGGTAEINSRTKPLFGPKPTTSHHTSDRIKKSGGGPALGGGQKNYTKQKDTLKDALRGNTRAAKDPFLAESTQWEPRGRSTKLYIVPSEHTAVRESAARPSDVLVSYNSDTEQD